MAKNLVNGTNIIIEENGDNINLELSSSYSDFLDNKINNVIQSGTNNNQNYIKAIDGTMICYGKSSDITTAANAGVQATITLPQQFIDANYVVTVTPTHPTAYWGEVLFSTTDFTTSSFKISTWNSGSSTNANQVFSYIAIGKWK